MEITLNIYWIIGIIGIIIYYSVIIYVIRKNKKIKNKNVDELQKNDIFVNNSTFDENSFESILDEMEEDTENNKLLDEFKSLDVEGNNNNPLTQKKDEIFKIIRNDENQNIKKKSGNK